MLKRAYRWFAAVGTTSLRAVALTSVSDHWSFMLGEVALYSFVFS